MQKNNHTDKGSPIITIDDITVVVLAGGQGRRMGGQDKGLLLYRDKPMIEHILQALIPQCGTIIINANRNHENYRRYGYPVFADQHEGFQGPLAGFHAAMNVAKTRFILTLPCDGKVVIQDYVQQMINTYNQKGCELVVATDGERLQPVYALIPTSLSSSLALFLESGERKIDRWYHQHHMCEQVFHSDQDLFANINRPDDLDDPAWKEKINKNQRRNPAVIGFSAFSGTGKTTLLRQLIPILRARRLRLAVIKHAHHDFEIDHPGKDSYELRKADACQVLISSSKRRALITEVPKGESEPGLQQLIDELDHSQLDLILVEGFKREHFTKIELHRDALQKPYLYPQDSDIIAVVTDHPLPDDPELPVLDLNAPDTIAEFIFSLVHAKTAAA